jgi:hypothetical protein
VNSAAATRVRRRFGAAPRPPDSSFTMRFSSEDADAAFTGNGSTSARAAFSSACA